MNRFPHGIVDETAHRPWSMPSGPWLMTQTWNDLLFAHWPVDARALRERVPAAFELDLFDGEAWIAVVAFRLTNVAPRFVPALPWISAFPELNVRTYVRVNDKPGVFFFSLDAGNPVAVGAARALLNLPYCSATMSVDMDGGDPQSPSQETLEYFLTERYCLYAIDHTYRAYRLEIHHAPWRLERGAGEISINSMTEVVGIALPDRTPLLHFAKRQDAICWKPEKLV